LPSRSAAPAEIGRADSRFWPSRLALLAVIGPPRLWNARHKAACRRAALRAEHDRHTSTPIDDETSILANAERVRAALISAATDALRDALRRTLGTVRCQPTVEGETLAQFAVGDAAVGTKVLEELYARAKDTPLATDLPALWRGLGIYPEDGTVKLREDAPLANIRDAIMRAPLDSTLADSDRSTP